MMKKTLSLLLALVMTVGLVPATVVQAAENNDVVYVDESTSMSELVESGIVQTSQPVQKPANKPSVPQVPVAGQVVKEDVYTSTTVCDCGMGEADIYSHGDSCALRQYYLRTCGSTAQEVYDLWRNAGTVTREFLMDHLEANYPETLEQVRVLIDAEADPEADLDKDTPVRLEGEASATVDGVTVDALGVPEGSALTVQAPSREAQMVVREIVEQAEKEPEQLFLYDISVQNDRSDDWQPEDTSVELKLSIPGLELHKYAEVRIFHVDDEGNTSIINGELDEEGKIVFETEGFSTFAGFTVDFSYGAALVSIPGETSILMSQLFDQMRIPLYASDVVDVQFTDDSLLTVTRQENDWLLTSLKAFTTTEALTFTMKDGKVYQFDVTDATTPTIQTGSGTPVKDGNDLTRWFACANGLLTAGASPTKWQSQYWSKSDRIIVSGPGGFTFALVPDGDLDRDATACFIYMSQIQITGGAHVKCAVYDHFQNPANGNNSSATTYSDTTPWSKMVNVILCSYDTAVGQNRPMFDVLDGSLELAGCGDIVLNLRGSYVFKDDKGVTQRTYTTQPLIYLDYGATSFKATKVTFYDAKRGGVFSRANNLASVSMTNCIFESTVGRNEGPWNGGAIYMYSGDSGNECHVDKFTLNGCEFQYNKAGSYGGALYLGDYINELDIKNCKFTGCESEASGGAIYIRASIGKMEVNAEFINCKAKKDGGAIAAESAGVNYKAAPTTADPDRTVATKYNRMHTLNLNNCKFTGCQATAENSSTTDGSGGGVYMAIQIQKVNISGCTFDKCISKGTDTNFAGGGISFAYSNLGDIGTEYSGSPSLPWTDAMKWPKRDSSGYIVDADGSRILDGDNKAIVDVSKVPSNKTSKIVWYGTDARNLSHGWWVEDPNNDGNKDDACWRQRITFGDVSITNTTFKDTEAFQGGGLLMRTGSCTESLTVTNTVFDGCIAADKGSAIFYNNCVVGTSDFTNCTIRNCVVQQSLYTGGGTFRTTGQTCTVLTLDRCKFLDNEANLAGGGLYWNAGHTKQTPDMYATGTAAEETMVTVKDCEFRRNKATVNPDYPDHVLDENDEPIVYQDASGNWLRNTRFGGGIFAETIMVVQRCIFDGNRADLGGGLSMGVYNAYYRMFEDDETTQLALDSSTEFFNNQAVNGGGIAIRANATMAINDGDNLKHTVDFTLGGAKIYNNVATHYGGGIYYVAETYDNPLENAEVENYIKTLNINDGTIYGNSAGHNGGGIYMNSRKNTTINVSNGTIYDNHAGLTREITITKTGVDADGNNVCTTTVSEGSATGGHGGGIYMTGTDTTVNITGGVIGAYLEESTNEKGEKIQVRVASPNVAKISDSNFGGNGGGIAVYDGGRIEMSGGYVVYNKSDLTGGGIAVYNSSSMYLLDGHVDSNESTRGGGIAIYGSVGDDNAESETKQYGMYLNGGYVTNNKAVPGVNTKAYGGGIYVAYTSDMKINNGEIANNMAAENLEGTAFGANQEGGGIAVYQNSNMVISGGKIRNNQAYDGGGILVRSQCTVTMTGEVKVEDGVVTSYDGAILDNRAERRGGGIYMPTDGNSSMVMTGGYIYNNKCEKIDGTVGTECLGGGMMVRSTNTFTLDGGRIDGNTAFSGGGIQAYYATKISIKNGVLSGNTALRHGGAIYNDYSYVEVTGGEFSENQATKGAVNYSGDMGKGGAIFNFGMTDAPFTFVVTGDGANFHDNEAKESGGAVYNGGVGTVTISGGTFTANTAVVQGGGICNDGCTVTITTGKFEENEAKDGGAIYAKGGAVTVSGGEFKSNLSTRYGGAVCFEETTSVTFENGTFDGNVSKSGGGLCIINSTVGFTGGNFENNIADRGGAAFIRSSTVTIDTITVKNNHAQADDRYGENEWLRGGGISVDTYGTGPAVVTINGGTFTGNTAERGGGLWIRNNSTSTQKYATLTVNGGTVSENSATLEGGGIWIGGGNHFSDTESTSLIMNGGTISGNSTDKRGGGIWAGEQAQVSILATATTHGEVTGNTANNGGGIYITSGADLTVTNGYITYNHAKQPSEGTLTTAYGISEYSLYGTGGGICVMNGSDSDLSTFTLNKVEGNNNMAIYGNTATFCADDVFANGNNTLLNVPQVADMNLADYGFKPEGWFEDYRPNDLSYGVEIDGVTIGLNMLAINGAPSSVNVMRYRSANAVQRRYMHIKPEYVSATGVNKEDAYVAMTLGIPAAADDTVVIDYGSKVIITAWQNDLFMEQDDFKSTSETVKDEQNNDVVLDVHHSYIGKTLSAVGDKLKEKDGVYYSTEKPSTTVENGFWQNYFSKDSLGKLFNQGDGTFTFELLNMKMDQEDTFFYMVEHNGVWYYANITVVPATTIYFEDNATYVTEENQVIPFVKYHKPGSSTLEKLAEWKQVGSVNKETQNEDRPGAAILEGLDADNIYGYDGSYTTTETYSQGSARKVTVTRDKTTKETTSARASFTFTGTGFDIVSLCSANTGIVMVSIYKGEVLDFDNPPHNDRYVTSYMVDTHYGFVYNIETGKWELDENSDTSLYQVPIIKVDLTNVRVYEDDPNTEEYDPDYSYKDYGYGTYTAELYVANSFLEREPGYWSADFYLDAIRIYNPAGYDGIYSYEYDAVKRDAEGNPMYDAEGNPLYEKVSKSNATDTVKNTYESDEESWPVYAELRNMFIAQKDLNAEGTSGIIFIDGQENPSLQDYKSWGPNNEVYLNPGQSIAFTLDATGYAQNVASVQVGLRGLTGMGNVLIQSKGSDQNSYSEILERKLSTTDLYYDISSKDAYGNIGVANKVVLITNPEYIKDEQGNDVKNTTSIAITNIKVTHRGVPTQNLSPYFMSNKQTESIAMEILTAEQLIDPVIKPEHPALSFDGMIRYHVFFSVEELGELTANDLGLAVFGSYDPDGTVETAKDVIMGATEIEGLYMIATNGVHAKYLGDQQYFRVFAQKNDGSIVYSKMVGYSAVDYAKNALANSAEPALRQLAVAMLNYGAEAQKFFGYKTDDLINKDLTADDQALLNGFDADALNRVQKVDVSKVGCFASTGGFTKKAPAISFKGAFEINYFFNPAYAVDGDLKLYFWNEDTYNSVTELTAENADKAVVMELKDGAYTASSDEIAAKYLDKTLYVAAVYESNSVTYCSGVLPYSIAAYCQNSPAGVQDLAAAAAIYGCTAKQYFGV